MSFSLLLHLHQPPTQFRKVLKKIYQESYVKILNLLLKYQKARITLSLTASLVEQLQDEGKTDFINSLKQLISKGQVEVVQTAAYHPLLIFLPDDEIERQIRINRKINEEILAIPISTGFFPPEMAINSRVLKVIRKVGVGWVVAEESAPMLKRTRSRVFTHPSGLKVVLRSRSLSRDVAFSKITTVGHLLKRIQPSFDPTVLAMDGETFGHHQPSQLSFLQSFLALSESSRHRLLTISELVDRLDAPGPFEVTQSTWAGSLKRWKNKDNSIHDLQWNLTNLAVRTVRNSPLKMRDSLYHLQPVEGAYSQSRLPKRELPPEQRRWLRARLLLDKALHSDQYWWAAKNPCWHYKMVERGARLLLETVKSLPDDQAAKKEAKNLYDQIVKVSLSLYGDTTIGC